MRDRPTKTHTHTHTHTTKKRGKTHTQSSKIYTVVKIAQGEHHTA